MFQYSGNVSRSHPDFKVTRSDFKIGPKTDYLGLSDFAILGSILDLYPKGTTA